MIAVNLSNSKKKQILTIFFKISLRFFRVTRIIKKNILLKKIVFITILQGKMKKQMFLSTNVYYFLVFAFPGDIKVQLLDMKFLSGFI